MNQPRIGHDVLRLRTRFFVVHEHIYTQFLITFVHETIYVRIFLVGIDHDLGISPGAVYAFVVIPVKPDVAVSVFVCKFANDLHDVVRGRTLLLFLFTEFTEHILLEVTTFCWYLLYPGTSIRPTSFFQFGRCFQIHRFSPKRHEIIQVIGKTVLINTVFCSSRHEILQVIENPSNADSGSFLSTSPLLLNPAKLIIFCRSGRKIQS